ncbi:hypothetical protein [Nonomuraea longicatena]|uniref:DUF4352 domain-containing protein n=1 Tax=Nonomuraea longicatena TaxID=83682 RepID=A0ABP4BC73_9ACTN
MAVVTGMVLIGAAVALQTTGLTPNEISAPVTSVGGMGEVVDTGRFSVRVDAVETAKAVETETKTVPAGQLFLVVSAAATSATEPVHLDKARLLTASGEIFDATDKVLSSRNLHEPWVQPGMWTSGYFVFEVPASALSGARVVMSLPTQVIVEPYAPEAEIDLGLDAAAAKRLAAEPKDVYSLRKPGSTR